MKIGVLSDTHSYVIPQIFDFFAPCNEIWHCGDIGDKKIINDLISFKPLRAVFGNIDGQEIRNKYNDYECFVVENTKVCMTHIGGYPPRYNPKVIQLIKEYNPALFVCGHSHILKIMFDKTHHLLYVNPGAAGMEGFHKLITFVRFDIEDGKFYNMEVFQKERDQNQNIML